MNPYHHTLVILGSCGYMMNIILYMLIICDKEIDNEILEIIGLLMLCVPYVYVLIYIGYIIRKGIRKRRNR